MIVPFYFLFICFKSINFDQNTSQVNKRRSKKYQISLERIEKIVLKYKKKKEDEPGGQVVKD